MHNPSGKKFALLLEDPCHFSTPKRTVYRIQALRDFAHVRKGDLGGYLACEENLSQEGDCWVADNAAVLTTDIRVSDNAQIAGDARVYRADGCNRAKIYGNARIEGRAHIIGAERICGNAYIGDDTYVSGGPIIDGTAEIRGRTWVLDSAEVHQGTHHNKTISGRSRSVANVPTKTSNEALAGALPRHQRQIAYLRQLTKSIGHPKPRKLRTSAL